MKKCIRVIAAVLIVAAALSTAGCGDTGSSGGERALPRRFEYVDNASAGTDLGGVKLSGCEYILVDTLTGVLYLYKNTKYGGGITVLLDANGMPLTLDGGQHEKGE